MWSLFYYNKKHYNFIFALIIVFPKLISSLVNIIIYLFLFKTNLKKKYSMRLSGLINSIMGKPSWYRITLN